MFLEICQDENGNNIVYKGGRRLWVDEGGTVTIAATVAEHCEYRGEPQTVIKRPKLIERAA